MLAQNFFSVLCCVHNSWKHEDDESGAHHMLFKLNFYESPTENRGRTHWKLKSHLMVLLRRRFRWWILHRVREHFYPHLNTLLSWWCFFTESYVCEVFSEGYTRVFSKSLNKENVERAGWLSKHFMPSRSHTDSNFNTQLQTRLSRSVSKVINSHLHASNCLLLIISSFHSLCL